MIDWSKIVGVTEQVKQEGLKEQNLSDLALFTTEPKPDSYKEDFKKYLNSADVATDFGTDSLPAKMAAKVFAQTPNIKAGNGSLIIIPMKEEKSKSEMIAEMQNKVNFFGIMFDDIDFVKSADFEDVAEMMQDNAMNKVLFAVSNDITVAETKMDGEIEVKGAFLQIAGAKNSKTRCLFYNGRDEINAAIVRAKAAEEAEAIVKENADKEVAEAVKVVATKAKAAADAAEEAANAAPEGEDSAEGTDATPEGEGSAEGADATELAKAIKEARTAAKKAEEAATDAENAVQEDEELEEVAKAAKVAAKAAKVAADAAADVAAELAAELAKVAADAQEGEGADATSEGEGSAEGADATTENENLANAVEAAKAAAKKAEEAATYAATEVKKVAEAAAKVKKAADATAAAKAAILTTEKEVPLGFMAAYAGRGLATNFNGYGTAFTMQLKTLNGVLPDTTIANTEYDTLMAAGVDCYPSFGIAKVATSGANEFFDVVVYKMAIKASYITSLFNSLATTPTKVAQTNAGLGQIMANAIRDLKKFQNSGVLASGVNWSSEIPISVSDDIFQLGIFQNGMYLWFDDINKQQPSEREERKTPPGFLAIKFAGAFHGIETTITFEN